MIKKRRTYQPRIVGDKVMMPADLKRLPEYMLEVEHIDHISDEMRAVIESEWPELARQEQKLAWIVAPNETDIAQRLRVVRFWREADVRRCHRRIASDAHDPKRT